MNFLLILTILLAPASLHTGKQLIPNDMYDPPAPSPTINCEYCDGVFYSQTQLAEHITEVHSFHCEYCEEVFFTQEELDAHIVSDHTYACPVCSEVFHSYSEKEAHVSTSHGRFVKDGNIIIDYQTNLQWRVGPDSDTDWHEANSWVNGLGGSWRMPSLGELGGLYNAGIKHGDWGHFQNSGYYVWSSQPNGAFAWMFYFDRGYERYIDRTSAINRRAFAVRSR